MKKVGGLWKNTKDERKFFTGTLDLGALGTVKIGVFPNDKKKNEKEPDFNITVFDK